MPRLEHGVGPGRIGDVEGQPAAAVDFEIEVSILDGAHHRRAGERQ
jgi:hypothetical protein